MLELTPSRPRPVEEQLLLLEAMEARREAHSAARMLGTLVVAEVFAVVAVFALPLVRCVR